MEKKVKVLVVDDDKNLTKHLRFILEKLHYLMVGSANSYDSACEQARKLNPDVILMDVIMETPYAGIEAAKSIRKELDIPIIFLTASREDETMTRALQSELYGYLVKPIQSETLKATIEVSILRHRYEKKLLEFQKALKESETLFRGIFSAMENGLYRLSEDDIILLINPAMVKMLGYSSEKELVGKNIFDLGFVDVESRKRFKKLFEKNEEVSLFESNWLTRSGSMINVIESAHTVRDKKGTLLYYEGTVQDITRLKELEAQLRHSQKMEIIGTLGGRIAHEINNRLTSILGYADLCLLKVDQNEKHYAYIKSIRDSARSAAGVIKQLLNFSRKQSNQPKAFDLNDLIRSMHEIIQLTIGKTIDLKMILGPNSMKIFADPKLVEQVIINLIINARDAMPDGGYIVIETCLHEVEGKYKGNSKVPPGSYVSIKIIDSGIGISPEIKSKIFEPFYTTKDESIGTGLGLSIVQDIVKESKGFISVFSRVGKGTSFEILFPAV